MATKTSLVATFLDATGASETLTWTNIDPEVSRTSVKQFVAGVVSYSSALLKTALTSCTEAVVRTTTDTKVDLT